MTCGHVPIRKETAWELTRVECSRCGHHWLEASIAMTHEEYDGYLVRLARMERHEDDPGR